MNKDIVYERSIDQMHQNPSRTDKMVVRLCMDSVFTDRSSYIILAPTKKDMSKEYQQKIIQGNGIQKDNNDILLINMQAHKKSRKSKEIHNPYPDYTEGGLQTLISMYAATTKKQVRVLGLGYVHTGKYTSLVDFTRLSDTQLAGLINDIPNCPVLKRIYFNGCFEAKKINALIPQGFRKKPIKRDFSKMWSQLGNTFRDCHYLQQITFRYNDIGKYSQEDFQSFVGAISQASELYSIDLRDNQLLLRSDEDIEMLAGALERLPQLKSFELEPYQHLGGRKHAALTRLEKVMIDRQNEFLSVVKFALDSKVECEAAFQRFEAGGGKALMEMTDPDKLKYIRANPKQARAIITDFFAAYRLRIASAQLKPYLEKYLRKIVRCADDLTGKLDNIPITGPYDCLTFVDVYQPYVLEAEAQELRELGNTSIRECTESVVWRCTKEIFDDCLPALVSKLTTSQHYVMRQQIIAQIQEYKVMLARHIDFTISLEDTEYKQPVYKRYLDSIARADAAIQTANNPQPCAPAITQPFQRPPATNPYAANPSGAFFKSAPVDADTHRLTTKSSTPLDNSSANPSRPCLTSPTYQSQYQ